MTEPDVGGIETVHFVLYNHRETQIECLKCCPVTSRRE